MNIAMNNEQFPDHVRTSGVHPQKFALWLGIACLIMTFAGLTSAYIVRKGAGNWVEFVLPTQFIISAVIIMMSSFTMQWAVKSFKNDKLKSYRLALGVTFILGIVFLFTQIAGWRQLRDIGIYLSGNPSGSFIYVISYIHFAHVVVGLLFMTITIIKSWVIFSNPANFIIYRTDSNKKIGIELLATYWHFVGVLWLYLLIFFIVI